MYNEQIPGSHKLSTGEQIAVYRELKRNPNLDIDKLARYWNCSVKEIKRAKQTGDILKWR